MTSVVFMSCSLLQRRGHHALGWNQNQIGAAATGHDLSGGGVGCQSLQGRGGCTAGSRSLRLSCAASMQKYENPYRDDPELVPLTRAGRLAECALAVLLALLAIYLSR